MTTAKYSHFIASVSVLLGGLVGFFVGVPASAFLGEEAASLVLPVFCVFGLLVGYKRRNDHWFFYLSLVSVGILSAIYGH